MIRSACFIATILLLSLSSPSLADPTSGRYLAVANDTLINTSEVTLLQTTINLSAGDNVFVETDGRYFPSSSNAQGLMIIRIDGINTGNTSLLDWNGSGSAQQHSFNAIAAKFLSSGVHAIALVAKMNAGSYTVGAGSNLSILIHPATQVYMQQPGVDTMEFNFTTKNIGPAMFNYTKLPHTVVTSKILNSSGADIVALASGRSYETTAFGDAMWGIFFDGSWIGFQSLWGSTDTLWTVNDMCSCAELQAPMYSHAFFPAPTSANHTISLDATEYPWAMNQNGGEDSVRYKVGADTALVVMAGGMTVRGSQHVLTSGFNDGYPVGPVVNGTVTTKVAETTISTPAGHGTVMFVAKARFQATGTQDNGNAVLYITVDGVRLGSSGVQGISTFSPNSQRTLSASYLATALASGSHTIRVFIEVDGSFDTTNNNPFIHTEIPLVYFE